MEWVVANACTISVRSYVIPACCTIANCCKTGSGSTGARLLNSLSSRSSHLHTVAPRYSSFKSILFFNLFNVSFINSDVIIIYSFYLGISAIRFDMSKVWHFKGLNLISLYKYLAQLLLFLLLFDRCSQLLLLQMNLLWVLGPGKTFKHFLINTCNLGVICLSS